jgi:hypothetical protein
MVVDFFKDAKIKLDFWLILLNEIYYNNFNYIKYIIH